MAAAFWRDSASPRSTRRSSSRRRAGLRFMARGRPSSAAQDEEFGNFAEAGRAIGKRREFGNGIIREVAGNLVRAFEAVNRGIRSEEHTSELQSRPHLVCRLLLEKKNRESYV